ncbi:bifunctional UDP-N-acetylmuramoyl-tripeptide:D-alanyl-D-alanine ligase/alanine racemase [Sediminibacterium sp.]|uniref:bifunctional UDP-N-acetylmuramoyl-tripeptide:D-alanyl-D-alanine ligase/alanine racemase n=1 Tax=Sediminibacterium sp. TaxID=1917865 RepID=UPI003F7207D4
MIQLNEIASILAQPLQGHADRVIQYLIIDSRNIVVPAQSIFFAIKGPRRSGSSFISEVYQQGVRVFVVDEKVDTSKYPDAVFFIVANSVQALQKIAAYHRKKFNIPIIGITGSNGKTIVKEWLYQLLRPDYNIVRSPRSYNSQIGVPLSIWQINAQHELGIFEVGISAKGEMHALSQLVQPTMGVLTNIGDAHNEGFSNVIEKMDEKVQLFSYAKTVITASDYIPTSFRTNATIVRWGSNPLPGTNNQLPELQLIEQQKSSTETKLVLRYQQQRFQLQVPFTDEVSIQNVLTCVLVLLQMNYRISVIQERVMQLTAVEMRMQLRKAINQSYLLNDSYSNDKISLSLALQFLKEQANQQPIIAIISDIIESGEDGEHLYQDVANMLAISGVKTLHAVGPQISNYFSKHHVEKFPFSVQVYASTEDLLHHLHETMFQQSYILLKGARKYAFEQIAHWLEQQVHQTIMEINLTAMVHNLKAYQSLLLPSTKMMAMVKAFGYGSGAGEVARRLQQQQVDYLTVAYADEGVTLRKSGIHLPIMVMSADEYSFDAMVNYSLEPELFSFEILKAFHQYISKQGIQQYPIHIKLNTGMNRLGFDIHEITALCNWLSKQSLLRVKSVLSHLAASEDPNEDSFTQMQVDQFCNACKQIETALGYEFIKHIANTAAIRRNPTWQFDMVRLGIGLYGADNVHQANLPLQTVATLKTTIAQIRHLKKGDTVSYNRSGIITRDSIIATVRIGYADGYSRRMGNGVGKMFIKGALAPTVGKICMDMCMIDITHIPDVKPGDTVEIFGKNISIQEVAKAAETISYEIMTGISLRVKRVYIEE